MIGLLCSTLALSVRPLQVDFDSALRLLKRRVATVHSGTQLTATVKSVMKSLHSDGAMINPALSVQRSKNFIFALVDLEGTGHGFAYLAKRKGAGYDLQTLYEVNDDSFLPTTAFAAQSTIVVGGLIGWLGNGPSAAAAILSPSKDGWHMGPMISTDFEVWQCKFRPVGSKWIADNIGRTYPTNINVAHVMANVEMSQRFVYEGGKLRALPAHRTMNPMAVLDDLAGEAAVGNLAALQRDCVSRQLAVQISKLGSKLKDSHWDTPSNTKATTDTQYISTSLGLQFNFVRKNGKWLLGAIKPTLRQK